MKGLRVLLILTIIFGGSSLAAPAEHGEGKKPAAQEPCPMDREFYHALYEFSLCDVAAAYKRLDKAIEELEPSENWDLYLYLYLQCFHLHTKHNRPVAKLNAEGKAILDALESKKNKSVGDLVKIRTITYSRKPLQEIVKRYPKSPWADWAEWELLFSQVHDAAAVARDSLKYVPYTTRAMLNDALIGRVQRKDYDPNKSIMRKWLLHSLCAAGNRQALRAATFYEAVSELVSDGKEKKPFPQDAWRKLFNDLRPSDAHLEGDLTRVFVCTGGGAECVVWRYFEYLRKAGIRLPACIPKDKDTFLEQAKDLGRFHWWNWWERNPDGSPRDKKPKRKPK
jgi:hypothetical protein